MFKVFAPATIGNVGPGFDILGLAVDGLGDEYTFVPKSDLSPPLITVSGIDEDSVPLDWKKNTVTIAAEAFFSLVGEKKGFDVHMARKLPIAGGLGSSAASSLAGAFGAAQLTNNSQLVEKILEAALEGEETVAGRHLDNIAPCLYGGLTLVNGIDPPQIHPFECGDFWITVVTPDIKMSTRESRKILPDHLSVEAWTSQMAAAISLVQGLVNSNASLVRQGVKDLYAEPCRAPFIAGFEQAKSQALAAGALGCSISGGGPSIFALSFSQEIAELVCEKMVAALKPVRVAHVGKIARKGVGLVI